MNYPLSDISGEGKTIKTCISTDTLKKHRMEQLVAFLFHGGPMPTCQDVTCNHKVTNKWGLGKNL